MQKPAFQRDVDHDLSGSIQLLPTPANAWHQSCLYGNHEGAREFAPREPSCAPMKKIEAMIKLFKIEEVQEALSEVGKNAI
ncbi:MAG: hypothetical protein NTW03_01895 [Verrucomicrobia bacterium]|nr:hypothetical protein [Verrucomicrobiota bacterium]